MATVYDLLNPDSTEVEEQRVIRAPGATTGDVLTVAANGTVSPAPGGSQPVTLTLTAAEIAARWSVSVGGAYVGWPAITADSRVLSFAVRANTLDQNADSAGYLYAATAGASSDAIDAASATLAPAIAGGGGGTYGAYDRLPPQGVDSGLADGVYVGRLVDDTNAAYVFVSGDAAPTTGEIVLELYAL